MISVLAALTGVWFAVTILLQLRTRGLMRLRRFDLLHLIPTWTFFAPNPGRSDFHVLWRDRLRDGSYTPWAQCRLGEARRLSHFLWNPDKRLEKVIMDAAMVMGVNAQLGAKYDEAILVDVPYLILLKMVAAIPPTDGSEARQFAVVERCPSESPSIKVVLRSMFHALTPDPARNP